MTIETLKSLNPRNRNGISVIKSKLLSVSSMNTLLAILKVTDERRDVILAGGLYHRFPWRHLPPPPPTPVRNEDAFTQRFRTAAKGVRTRFSGFGAIAAYGPKTRKKRVRIHFMKTWYGRFTRQKYLVHNNFFMVPVWYGRFTRQKYLVRNNYFMIPDPFFFCKWGFRLWTAGLNWHFGAGTDLLNFY